MNTFLNKVEIQRKILSNINVITSGKKQLAGLSKIAISNWCLLHNISFQSEISDIINELADLSCSFSSRSNENFNQIPDVDINNIEFLLGKLTDKLTQKFR